MSWGPSQPQANANKTLPLDARLGLGFAVWLVVAALAGSLGVSAKWAVITGVVTYFVLKRLIIASRTRVKPKNVDVLDAADPAGSMQEYAARAGGGAWVGLSLERKLVFSSPERAVLVAGPPRSGKTQAVIIPSLLSHDGPVVSTSTKADVLRATGRVRARAGRVWVFDPTGTAGAPEAQLLRWSPLAVSAEWDGAQLMARAMTATVGSGVSDGSHWARRAQALLAPMLHAAARGGLDMEQVVTWVMSHDAEPARALLVENHASRLATGSLDGIARTAERERSSIFSATADALDAYTMRAGVQSSKRVNFNAVDFVRSVDSIYIHAPAEHQDAVAPIVCSLLAEIRRQTYRAHGQGMLPRPVFFALDEVANIAPIPELPSIASEGGGQGLKLLAAVQDLSQARHRWGDQADGFLTLFGTKIFLPGIADTKTLESVSVALGEYDRRTVSYTQSSTPALVAMISQTAAQNTRTISTQRQRVLSPGEIANIPAGHLLVLDGVDWQLLIATPAHMFIGPLITPAT